VKVHYIFNLALHVACGSPYATLLERISKKLQQPGGSITLRYYAFRCLTTAIAAFPRPVQAKIYQLVSQEKVH